MSRERDREPRPIRDGLDSFARRLGAPRASSLGAVFGRWEDTVGATIAAHCRPVSLTDGILVVAADGPAWATQVRYMSTDLLGRLRTVCGPDLVGRIVVRVEPPGGRREGARKP